MLKMYAIFEGNKILKMSWDKQALIDYRNSFPLEQRVKMILAEKHILGPKEHQQGHFMFQ